MKIQKIASILLLVVFVTVMILLVTCRNNEPKEEPPMEAIDEPKEQEPPRVLEEFTFTHENYPRMDGSPVTVPLAQATACVLLGESRENVADRAVFTRTTQAYRDLAAGLCDILIVGEPTPGVLGELADKGFNIEMAPIALDALVFIVNESNPVKDLTSEQLREIYTGVITNWQQVGGEDIEITAFQRNEEAASQVLMQKLVMDWQPMMNAPTQNFSASFEMDEFITAIKGFDGSAGALGYTLYYYAEEMRMAEGLKIISIDGIAPDTDTIKDGSYPLLNPYYAAIEAGEPEDGATRMMFNWLLSEEGQDLISNEGYVSISESSRSGAISRPELRWKVMTDHNRLAPYIPLSSSHTRLSDGQMPEFIPSETYGTLLPYSSAATLNDGSMRVSRYGFVTTDGVVATDLIYDNILRAVSAKASSRELLPAYQLQVRTPDLESTLGFQTLNAACALDGRWITPFEYADIVFTDEFIFLMRDHETFDIDVYSYNGQELYNIKDLSWASSISEDTWSEAMVYGVNEGFGFVLMDDDTYGLLEVLTGKITETDFTRAFMFSEGLAAVIPEDSDDLWGFVDLELELVIPPGFVHETSFVNGQAVVETPDGSQHIIDTQGEELFSVTSEYYITQNHDGFGFSVHVREGWDFPKFYTSDLTEIELPADAVSLGPESIISYLSNGWYYCTTEEGMWLFTRNDAHLIPQHRNLIDFVNGYIIYSEQNENYTVTSYGVMTPDGTDIIPLQDAPIIPAVSNETTTFILNTAALQGQFISATYTTAVYDFVDSEASTIRSGLGILSYDESVGLFYIQGTDYSAWMSLNGFIVTAIPSMAYSFD